MICNECGKEYFGNQCSCIGKKKYKKDEITSKGLSAFDSKHRDNFMHYVKLMNEIEHWNNLESLTKNSIFTDLKLKTLQKIDNFRRAQGRHYESVITVPWFWRCHAQECDNMGTMSSVGDGEVPRYCKNHFSG